MIRKRNWLLPSIILFLLIAGFSSHQDKITGSYYYGNLYDSHALRVRSNHTYHLLQTGCTYGFEFKGKCSINEDTLSLFRKRYRRPARGSRYRTAKDGIDYYLIRKDLLIELTRRDSGGFYQDDTLRKE